MLLNGVVRRFAGTLPVVLACALGVAGCTTESGGGSSSLPGTTKAASPTAKPKPSASGSKSGSGSRSGSASPVKKYGAGSRECSSVQLVMAGAARVGLRAAVGKVTESDVTDTWTADVVSALPAPASELSEQLHERAVGFIGLDGDAAAPMIAGFSTTLQKLTAVATTICSAPPPPPKPKPTPSPTASGSRSASPTPSPSRT